MGFKFPDSFQLAGKVAIIAGVGPTNSRSFAIALAEAGANVCLIARKSSISGPIAEELRILGVKAIHVEADLTDPEQVDAAVQATLKELGRVDILFNHVGGAGTVKPLLDLNYADWQRIFAVNLDSMFLCTKAVARVMIEQGDGGSIINTSSTAARTTLPQLTAYSVAKAGVEQFTRCMAKELADHRIRVNCIRLGTFENAGPHMDGFGGEGFGNWFLGETPMHRWGKAGESAAAGLFFASEASAFVTGSVLAVSGGFATI